MSELSSGVIVSATSLVAGWAALWPIRGRLGAWGYHLWSLPIGMLGWCVVAVVSSLLRRPFDATSTAVGLAAFVLMLWLLALTVRRDGDSENRRVPFWTYLVTGGVLSMLASLAAAGRLTVASADSWGAYWPYAAQLSRAGELVPRVFSERGLPLISMGAADILFGGNWAYVEYQMLAVSLALALGWLVARDAVPRVGRLLGGAIASAVTAVLALNATFLFNAFYVHSHSLTALYLLLALGALRLAVDPRTGRAGPDASSWLLVAGLCTAGLALARPEGLVISLLPISLAIGLLTDDEWHGPDGRSFFAAFLAPVYVVYAGAFLRLGLWSGVKLTGSLALLAIAGISLTALGPALVRRVSRRYDVSGPRVLPLALAVFSLALSAAFVVKWGKLSLAVLSAGMNLFGGQGGWGSTWYWLVGLLALSLVTADALKARSWTRSLFLTTALFFVLIFTVNMSRGGRPGWGDSMNRMMFHIVPVALWYVGLVVVRITGDALRRGEAEES